MRQQLALVDARARAAGRTGAASGGPACRRRAPRASRGRRTSSPIVDHRLARRRRPPQHRAQPREQLVDPDRLRHVVVGAASSAATFSRSSPTAESTITGAELQVRSSRHDVGAGAVREDEVEDHRLGRAHRRRRERRLARSRPSRPRSRRRAGSSAARAGSAARRRRRGCAARSPLSPRLDAGRASTNVAPWPGRDSAHTRPPFASAKPRAIASPSPAPRPAAAAPRWNGSKIRSRSSERDAGAVVDRRARAPRSAVCADAARAPARPAAST